MQPFRPRVHGGVPPGYRRWWARRAVAASPCPAPLLTLRSWCPVATSLPISARSPPRWRKATGGRIVPVREKALEIHSKTMYISTMGANLKFAGTVLRVELDGFAIVKFDEPVGPSANTHGLISISTGTASVPFAHLRPGIHVVGTAEADEHDLASIKTIRVTQTP
jgi:hypothetical protein